MSESPPPGEAASTGKKVIRLTNLGRIAHLYGTMTAPEWWRQQFRDIEREQDQGTDWQHMIEERIKGLEALRDAIETHGSSWLGFVAEQAHERP